MRTHNTAPTVRRLLTVTGAVLAVALAWAVIEGLAGFDLQAPAFDDSSPRQDVGLVEVIISSLGAGLVAWGLLALLERYVSQARRIWTALAATGLVLSLGGPMSGTGIDTTNRSLLVLLHLIVAAALIPFFYRTANTRDREE